MNNSITFKKNYHITDEHLDPDYKHVHHATIVKLLEKARVDFLDYINQPLDSFIKNNLFIVLSNINVEFLRELVAGAVIITCEDISIKSRQILIKQRIIDQHDKEIVNALIDLRIISRELGRSITIPKELKEAMLVDSY